MEKCQKAKKKDTEEESNKIGTLSKLPSDIIIDILSRIPVKSLFDCRWVCKSWLTLVRDPRVAKLNLTRAFQNENPSIIFPSDVDLYILDNLEESNVPIKLKLPFMASETSFKFMLVGSCNGLVCLMTFEINPSVYIFNPITGEYVKLPKPNIESKTCPINFAFCYHPPTNEYRVFNLRNSYGEKTIEIYTASSNSWRKIKVAKFMYYYRTSSDAVLNGAIHWFSARSDIEPMHSHIVSFDVEEEEFRVVEHPAELPPDISSISMDVGVLGGCLSLFYVCPSDMNIDQNIFVIWVMKEYGVKESWTKQFVIKETGIIDGTLEYIRPLCVLNNGKILLQDLDGLFISYDPESKMVTYVEIDGVVEKYQSITHVESLVSLRTNFCGVEGQR